VLDILFIMLPPLHGTLKEIPRSQRNLDQIIQIFIEWEYWEASFHCKGFRFKSGE
jgi:hypothetical protein